MKFHIHSTSSSFSHWIFAFYGFGQQASVYDSLKAMCQEQYGFVVIDLPYEKEDKAMSKLEFANEINTFIQTHNITSITGISYSMGSRYNLIMAECLPQYISQLFVIAPDGVRINFWNRIATSTIIGQVLFRWFMKHPGFYKKILHLVYTIGLLPQPLYAFSKWHVRSLQSCSQVYNSWVNMKNMIPSLNKLQQSQQEYNFSITAYFGKRDTVINERSRKLLAKKIPNATIILLQKGHKLLDDKLFADIAHLLKP